jgi:hypothetical protein
VPAQSLPSLLDSTDSQPSTGDPSDAAPRRSGARDPAEFADWRRATDARPVLLDLLADSEPATSADQHGDWMRAGAARRGPVITLEPAIRGTEDDGGDWPGEGLSFDLLTPANAAAVGFTAGFIWWLTRSGGMLTMMLMGIPAWRHVDLLPVLARPADDDRGDDMDDDKFIVDPERALDTALDAGSHESRLGQLFGPDTSGPSVAGALR